MSGHGVGVEGGCRRRGGVGVRGRAGGGGEREKIKIFSSPPPGGGERENKKNCNTFKI